jgi:uncharacterized protein YjbJ (UPF0337 family)
MNEDILAGKWKQLRGEIREKWGDLTDDDLDRVAGQRDKLVGILQERYGYTRDEAAMHVDDFTRDAERRYGDWRHGAPGE